MEEHREELASSATVDPAQQALLARYVDAFERYDVAELVTLLRDDVVQSMAPYRHWLVGPDEIHTWFLGPGAECRGSRLVATAANGSPAFGQYRRNAEGEYYPWALQVLEISGDRVAGMHFFLDTDLFEALVCRRRCRPHRGSTPTSENNAASSSSTARSTTTRPARAAHRRTRSSASTRARSGGSATTTAPTAVSPPCSTSTISANRRAVTRGVTPSRAENHRRGR